MLENTVQSPGFAARSAPLRHPLVPFSVQVLQDHQETMKLSHLSAVMYGLSSSTTSSAFANFQRRCFSSQRSPLLTATWETAKSRNTLRSYRPYQRSQLELHSHMGAGQNRHYFSFLTPQQQQRRMVPLSSATGTTEAYTTAGTRTSSDPNDFDFSGSPAFRLFYNDVYEVNLPPKHRFPMGKYRKVRESVQEKLAKSSSEDVECGKLSCVAI